MAEWKEKSEWNRTAILLMKIHNVNCTKKSEMIKDYRDVHPWYISKKMKKEEKPSPADMAVLEKAIRSM